MTSTIRIGCSGWQYKHWRGDFYPADLPPARWLEFYASHFDTVEINNSFYRLPEPAVFASWRRRVPAGFIYAVKASRFLTHMKKLKDPEEPLERFFSHARPLGARFGPVLYQLPPRWPVNVERLQTFLKHLPRRRRHAIEFREPSWYSDEVLAMLELAGVAMVLHDMKGSTPNRIAIGPFVYLRFHGTTRYGGRYDEETLEGWAEWLAPRINDGVPVYAYFNNDVGGHAPRDAKRLREAIGRRVGLVKA